VAVSTAQLCRDFGLDVKSVKEEGWEGKDDEELLRIAIAEERVVLSFDKDFGNLMKFPLQSHHGVIVVEMHDQRPHQVNARLKRLLPIMSAQNLRGRLVIIRDGDVRQRWRPL
jgi:predicted nuclease of predicted toxin-antitoxin system